MGPLTHTISRHVAPMSALALLLLLQTSCEPPTKRAGELDPEITAKAKENIQADPGINPSSRLSEQEQQLALAIINNEVITLGEYERRLNDQPPFARSRYNSIERKRAFLDDVIQFEVLADEAEKKGYDKDPGVVLNLKQAMVRKMMADYIEKTVKLSDISEEEIRKYYDAHLDDYVRPEKIRTSQIVFSSEADANKVIEELKAEFAKDPTHKRKIFQSKANALSIDKATAERDGDMEFYARPEDGGTVPKAICDPAFAMENVEEMVGPIKTDAGWHVVMLMGRKQRFERSFEDVKRSIANRLYREKRVIAEKEYIDEAKKGATIKPNTEILSKIPDPAPSEAASDPHGGEHGEKSPQ